MNHELWHQRDPSGYVRFISAMNFDLTKKNVKKLMKDTFSLQGSKAGSSLGYWEEADLRDKVSESFANGTFIEIFLFNKEQYLSKKAIRKFFKQN